MPKEAAGPPPVEFSRAVGPSRSVPGIRRHVFGQPGVGSFGGRGQWCRYYRRRARRRAPGDWRCSRPPSLRLEEPLRVYDAAGKRMEEDCSQRLMEPRDGGDDDAVFKGKWPI